MQCVVARRAQLGCCCREGAAAADMRLDGRSWVPEAVGTASRCALDLCVSLLTFGCSNPVADERVATDVKKKTQVCI